MKLHNDIKNKGCIVMFHMYYLHDLSYTIYSYTYTSRCEFLSIYAYLLPWETFKTKIQDYGGIMIVFKVSESYRPQTLLGQHVSVYILIFFSSSFAFKLRRESEAQSRLPGLWIILISICPPVTSTTPVVSQLEGMLSGLQSISQTLIFRKKPWIN